MSAADSWSPGELTRNCPNDEYVGKFLIEIRDGLAIDFGPERDFNH